MQTTKPELSPRQAGDLRGAPPLPPAGSSIQGQKSPLSGVIADGLTKLAAAEGWQAQQSALDVLVGAMVKTGRESPPKADAMTEMAFGKLLAQHAPPGGQADARRDAKQLASLAVVALGSREVDGQRRADREKQLETDLGEIRSALADVLARPQPERTARLTSLVHDLEWVAGIMGRSKSTQMAQPRVDAVAGMLKILLQYAGGGAPQ